MNEKYVLVEHLSAINTVIQNIFQSTQRIKFTSFDVSNKYITFGANSGGVYIFSRKSCQFIKLIPGTHGSVNLLAISEDETNLAVAVSTGLVLILEDCFNAGFQQQIFIEHEGNTVTALKWNGNDLFCGDSTGKVSVITLKNFLTKAMFQAPMACLMHLDSAIVQLDAYSKFLLVSTFTRSLLCDTETERYRQIGKKSRDGRFGACFFNVSELVVEGGVAPPTRGVFQTVDENEKLSSTRIDDNVKIYCARPGARLWQADFQADVIVTHQFRSSLNVKQTNFLHWDDAVDASLKMIKFDDSVGENFNFVKIFTFLDKFIMTFRDDGFYIFEPSSSSLLFWRRLQNVKDVKIVNSSLYIWQNDFDVSIMSLFSVEELILKSLFKKQYTLCGQLCVEFFDDVQSMIETSKKIHLISALESKLDDREILDKLSPILQRLKECAKAPTLEKLKNGIVSVNNLASIKQPEIPETIQSTSTSKKKEPEDILLEQYKINKIHKNIETSDFNKLMKSSNPNEFYTLINIFSKNLKEDDNTQFWCEEMFLKYLKVSENFDLKSDALNYACNAFQQLNSLQELACECNFPLPKAYKSVPKYYEIGCILMEKSCSYEVFQKHVPHMNRLILEKIKNTEEIQSKLALIIQYSDSKIMKNLSSMMPYDVWDDSIRLMLKLKNGHCLNCGKEIDISESFEWKNFGLFMVQSIKAVNTLKLFKRYANSLPKGTLDQFFYQYCIFSSISGINNSIFNEIVDDENVKRQLEDSVGGYLRKTYLNGGEYDPSLGYKPSEMINDCDHCQLPLRIPLVEETRMLNCGHKYHQVCFLYNKKHCTVCEQIL